ncbi:DUF4867 family protein [Latilactobacillus curvatus]|uniref:DUF4867 family protein n=1 Tax=Latilactobacillus curvatus TaxID=28038 RepID=UPI00345E6C9F
MTTLEALQAANPQYQILTVDDPSFRQFGVYYPQYDLTTIKQAMASIPVKDQNVYVTSNPQLEAIPMMQAIGRDVFAGMAIEAGECTGHTSDFSAIEYHQGSEVNITLTDVVMVLGKRADLEPNKQFDPYQDAKLFYIPAGQVVEFYSDTLHYSPIQVTAAGFKVIVMLLAGSNEPFTQPLVTDNHRIVKQNKFQLVHASRTDKIEQGIQVGVTGELIKIKSISI